MKDENPPRVQRYLWRTIKCSKPGVARHLPPEMRNATVFRSKKGPMGQVVVRRWTGVDTNYASRALRTFVKNVGDSNEAIAHTMASNPTVTKEIRRLSDALLDPKNSKKSLAWVVAETGTDAAAVVEHYAKGAVHLKKWECVAMAAQDMPRMVREMIRFSLPKKGLCRTCLGARKIVVRNGRKPATEEVCLTCGGEGWTGELSKEALFAMDKLTEISQLIEKKGPLVAVQQNTTMVSGGNGSRLMEKIVGLSDEQDIVDGEVVELPQLEAGANPAPPATQP